MGTQMNEHGQRWEEQQERLSAYLDGRLTPGERSSLERHIAQCARCTAEVEELRQVVAVLGAMPAPRLPRSFALPETATPETSAPGRVTASRQARRTAPAWTQVARWAGGLAAAAGFVLLVGSGLVGLGGHMAGGAGASTASSARQVPAIAHGGTTPGQPSDLQHGAASPTTVAVPPTTGGGFVQDKTATPTQASGAGNAPTPITAQHTPRSGQAETGISLDPRDLPLAGAGLLVVGAATFTAGSVGRRRRTPPSR